MRINDAMKLCFDNGIKIYPTYYKMYKCFRIIVNYNDIEKPIKKDLKQKEINNALTKTYIHYANKFV